MIIGIKEIILTYELLNKRYYGLLLGYLVTLTSINFFRIELIFENIQNLFLALADSKNDMANKFAVDFLNFLSNLAIRTYISQNSDDSKPKNMKDVDFCTDFINYLINKKCSQTNFEVLRIFESIIDKNGYEIPTEFWILILDRFKMIVAEYERIEINVDVSKISLVNSLQHYSKNGFQLHFVI